MTNKPTTAGNKTPLTGQTAPSKPARRRNTAALKTGLPANSNAGALGADTDVSNADRNFLAMIADAASPYRFLPSPHFDGYPGPTALPAFAVDQSDRMWSAPPAEQQSNGMWSAPPFNSGNAFRPPPALSSGYGVRPPPAPTQNDAGRPPQAAAPSHTIRSVPEPYPNGIDHTALPMDADTMRQRQPLLLEYSTNLTSSGMPPAGRLAGMERQALRSPDTSGRPEYQRRKKSDFAKVMDSDIVVFKVGKEGREFRMHAGALSKQSSVLRALVQATSKKAGSKVIDWSHIDGDVFALFFEFAYSGDYTCPELAADQDPPTTDLAVGSCGQNELKPSLWEETAKTLFILGRLYVFADEKLIDDLKSMTLVNVQTMLSRVPVKKSILPEYCSWVDFVFGNTRKGDDLRAVICEHCDRILGVGIGVAPEFVALLARGGDFVVDLWRHIWTTRINKPL